MDAKSGQKIIVVRPDNWGRDREDRSRLHDNADKALDNLEYKWTARIRLAFLIAASSASWWIIWMIIWESAHIFRE